MKVEIWSDIMCPFCYIGKRRFEKALEGFEQKDKVEIIWKSFQLNPQMETDPGTNINQYLADAKGWSLEQAKEMNDRVTKMAAGEGLHYDFNRAVVANSFDAHRLIQLAKSQGKGDEAEERLFKAYFTEGKNIANHAVLTTLGTEIGIEEKVVAAMLTGNDFAEAVMNDVSESSKIGVTGVPFFVFNRRYGVSGAQEAQTFLDVLTKTLKDEL